MEQDSSEKSEEVLSEEYLGEYTQKWSAVEWGMVLLIVLALALMVKDTFF
jgi:hypothetical protein